ncbi:T9SS type A sorting domain-containing protein [Labilibacter sediminis]|nr:T9SS type A sorting domain-containing protein [Labilibacter sediminis]
MKNVFALVVAGLLLVVSVNMRAQVLVSDSLALVDIYEASGANWNQTWLKETIDGKKVGIKGWEGVTVEREEGSDFYRVTQLDIENINNNGVYPSGTLSPSIGNLSALKLLYLNGSEKGPRMLNLTGPIPEEIWNLTNLERLRVKYTNLTGGFPNGIEKMVNLEYINFQMTNLDCEIPEELFELPKLESVYMQQCNLKGAVPETLSQATKLFRLYIHENKLTSLPFVEVDDPENSKISIEANFFSFSDVEPYHAVNYLKFVDNFQYVQETEDIDFIKGEDVTMELGAVTGGIDYNWYKRTEGEIVVDEVVAEGVMSYTLSSVPKTETYVCKVLGDIPEFDVRALFVIHSSVGDGEDVIVTVSPNPFDDYILLKTDAEIVSVNIYGVAGNLVYNRTSIFANQYEVSTSHLTDGMYILKVYTSEGDVVKKIFK